MVDPEEANIRYIELSDKFHFLGEENQFSRKLKSISNNRVIDLTKSNPSKSGILLPQRAILESLGKKDIFDYSPDPKGNISARKEIANYYALRNEPTGHQNIFLASGTSEAFSYLLKLLTNPEDEILLPSPGYPLHEYLCLTENTIPVKYPIQYCGRDQNNYSTWKINFQELQRNISKRTKAIVLVSPNNPTGFFPDLKEVNTLCDIATRHNIPLIVDEVFSDFIHDSSCALPIFPEILPVFYLNGISKILGLPQLKLSWIRFNTFAAAESVSNALEFITDAYLSVNAPVQFALEDLFGLKDQIQLTIKERVRNNIHNATSAQNQSMVFHKPRAGWYGILEIPSNRTDEEIAIELLEDKNIITHPGYMFDLEGGPFLIVSLLTEESIFSEGLEFISSQKW